MIYIRLDKEIQPQALLKKIQEEINLHAKNNSLEESLLCIEIKTTSHIVEELVNYKALPNIESKL
jgi:hypothetical protein